MRWALQYRVRTTIAKGPEVVADSSQRVVVEFQCTREVIYAACSGCEARLWARNHTHQAVHGERVGTARRVVDNQTDVVATWAWQYGGGILSGGGNGIAEVPQTVRIRATAVVGERDAQWHTTEGHTWIKVGYNWLWLRDLKTKRLVTTLGVGYDNAIDTRNQGIQYGNRVAGAPLDVIGW